MNCEPARELIHAYSDGELDLVKAMEIENHLRECTACAAAHQKVLALRGAVREGGLYFRAPTGLEAKVRSRTIGSLPTVLGRRLFTGRWVATAAAITLIAGTIWLVLRGAGGESEELLAAEVTSAHVRSLMAEHLWDVKSTDRHTVKPWFEGKLDFAPDVQDFKAESFALEGGRLDYLANRPVAALVYRHEKHILNLFVWPAAGRADEGEFFTTRHGYVIGHWVQGGMNYWTVSDMSEDALRRFASLVRAPGAPTAQPGR